MLPSVGPVWLSSLLPSSTWCLTSLYWCTQALWSSLPSRYKTEQFFLFNLLWVLSSSINFVSWTLDLYNLKCYKVATPSPLFQIPPAGAPVYNLSPGIFYNISRSVIWFNFVGLNAAVNPVVYFFRWQKILWLVIQLFHLLLDKNTHRFGVAHEI